jgi:DNA-binding transcriptional regulator/RsmH inhibitor MraZ
MLSTSLRQRSEIQDTAVVVGVNTYAEIWNPERWRSLEDQQDQVWQIVETLEDKAKT